MSVVDTFRLAAAPPHRAGWPFIVGGIVLFVVGLIFAR
jgi:phosphatidylserine decarboxylase